MDSADSKPKFGEMPYRNTNSWSYITPSDAKAATSVPDSIQAVFHGSGIQHSGQGHFNVQGNVNITTNAPPDSNEAAEKEAAEKEVVEKCKKALFVTDPSEDRGMLKRKKGNRASGTCEWILKTRKLNTWLHFKETGWGSQSPGVLWLHGNPGTGKSTMVIYLTEKLSIDFKAMENMTLAYFFCDASFEKRKTATSIIRGLLYQLVQRHRDLLYKYILPKYKERGDQLFTSFDALWTIFIAAATDQDTGRKYCIIDALDECDNDSKDILLCQLHETFHFQEKPPPNLSILITSRPYPEIREYLQDFTNADLSSFNEARQDIDRCIKERVDDLAKKKNYTDKIKGDITQLLRDKAEGTFLWVGLACEELRRKPSKDAIQFLRDMPKGLISLYQNLLKTATEDETSESVAVRRILSFVVVSFEALSVRALSEACQLHQDEPDLDTRLQYTCDQIASCRLLVVVNDQKVQLLHQSVRDFLTGSGSGIFIERLEAHASVALRCIDDLIERSQDTSYLWRHEDDFFEQPQRTNPSLYPHGFIQTENGGFIIQNDGRRDRDGTFPNYAEIYWTKHVREAGEKFKICEPQIPFFETNSKSRLRWRYKTCGYGSNQNLLNVAMEYGLPILVEYALGMREVHPDMGGSAFNIKNDLDSLHRTDSSPLSCALLSHQIDRNTKAEMLNMLLKAGATVTRVDMESAAGGHEVDQEMALTLLHHMHLGTRKQYIQKLLRERAGWLNKFTPLLLAKYGDQIAVEEIAVSAAVLSSSGAETLSLLLNQRRSQTALPEAIMVIAAENEEEGGELIEILLKYQGYQSLVTQNIICAAMRNERQGQRIIQLLCQHQSGKITITSNILQTAVIREQGAKLLKKLLQHRGDQPTITITAYTLSFGIANQRRPRDTLSFILKELGNCINFSETMINAINVLDGKMGFIAFLIQNGGTHVVITDEVVKAVLDPNGRGYKYRFARMKLFFERQRQLKFTGRALATITEFMHNEIGGE
ncbi:hypothetical protein J3E69DRAFT_339720 [Trichoderma sp. SZMC 28015]